MIKLYIPDNFAENENIDSIFTELANKIYEDSSIKAISYTYHGETKEFSSVDDVKTFLVAKNFYEYKFYDNSPFLNDLFKLQGRTNIKSVLMDKTKNLSIKNFWNNYPKGEYSDDYNQLNNYNGLTIAKAKAKYNKKVKEKKDKIEKAISYTFFKGYRAKFLTALNIPVCPYCNMNYILNYNKKGKQKNGADIDHFYIKSKYPEYSLCLYNFIPSCTVCNERIKHENNMTRETHVYPYDEGFNDYDSHFEITNLTECLIDKYEKAKVIIANPTNNPKVNTQITDMCLNDLYANLNYKAKELINKAQMYHEVYVGSLASTLNGLLDKNKLKTMVFGPNLTEEEYGKRSLGKYEHDLLCQLDVFDDSNQYKENKNNN